MLIFFLQKHLNHCGANKKCLENYASKNILVGRHKAKIKELCTDILKHLSKQRYTNLCKNLETTSKSKTGGKPPLQVATLEHELNTL